jgi:hypothetical protein
MSGVHPVSYLSRCSNIRQDLITGDEIISDSYNLKEIDGVAYEADCKKITIGNESFGRL